MQLSKQFTRYVTAGLASAALALGVAGTASAQQYRDSYRYDQRQQPRCDTEDTLDKALGGAIIGGILGGVLGNDSRDARNGAIIGGGVGALACQSQNNRGYNNYGPYDRGVYRDFNRNPYNNPYRGGEYRNGVFVPAGCSSHTVIRGYDRYSRPVYGQQVVCPRYR